MYWRRFAISDIPLDDAETFDLWIRQRWIEKDEFLEEYMSTGRFPASHELESKAKDSEGSSVAIRGFIETEMKPAHWYEIFKVFAVLTGFGVIVNLLARIISFGSS